MTGAESRLTQFMVGNEGEFQPLRKRYGLLAPLRILQCEFKSNSRGGLVGRARGEELGSGSGFKRRKKKVNPEGEAPGTARGEKTAHKGIPST